MENVSEVFGAYALSIMFALAIFVIGKFVARKATDIIIALMGKKKGMDETLLNFFSGLIYYALLVMVVLAALDQVGINTTSFLAILGAAGLAIGLALKDSLSNFASGVMLVFFKPFKIGDVVNAGGVTGKVIHIHLFNTEFTTPDNQKILVPNSAITSGAITNINAHNKRRVDLVIGIGYDDDIKKAKNILNSIVEEHEKVLIKDGITVAVSELADSSVNFVVRAWVKTPDYWDVKFFLTEEIKLRFDKEGISIPYPQTDVHLYKKD